MNKTVFHKPIAHTARFSFSRSGGNGGQRESDNRSMTAGAKCKNKCKTDFRREKITILYEDEYLAVICKPDGMLSVPYPGSRAQTALEVLERMMRKKGTYSQAHRPFAVHRLDRETSGVMMFAMTEKAQKKIMDHWQTLVTGRIYRALAENPAQGNAARRNFGVIKNSGTIDDEIAYNAYNRGFVPHDKARFKTVSAITHYKIIERGAHHTLFELSLETGRKNQIRAHLASKGYVLAGDENYRAKTNPFGRLALHARTLEFNHPFTGEHLTFEIPEPEEWLFCVKNGDRRRAVKHPK